MVKLRRLRLAAAKQSRLEVPLFFNNSPHIRSSAETNTCHDVGASGGMCHHNNQNN